MFNFDCRHTKILRSIMKLFMESKKSLSAAEILKTLKDNHFPLLNKTTVYRQLDFLTKKQLITALEIDGSKHYQLNKNHPEAVLVCTMCKAVNFIKVKIKIPQLKEIAIKNNFQINHHSLMILGLCPKCQKIK